MADFVPIVQGLGGNKTCDLCGKQVSLGDTTRQTSMAADGITLTSNPPTHMHANCLREILKLIPGMRDVVARLVADVADMKHKLEMPAQDSAEESPVPVKETPPEVQ